MTYTYSKPGYAVLRHDDQESDALELAAMNDAIQDMQELGWLD